MSDASPTVDDVQRALDAGDWREARSLLSALPIELSDDERARAEALRDILGYDIVAIGIALALGLGLLAIVIALYT